MKKLAIAILALGLFCGTACNSTHEIVKLEQMSDLEYSKWKVYIELGVKIGANRLLQEKAVSHDQLNLAATAIDGIVNKPVTAGAKSLLIPALRDAGFDNDEVEFILLIAEQELLSRGALDWLNPETNVIELSPRTKEMLGIISTSLRSAGVVTQQEKVQASNMKADFSRKQ